MFEMSKFLSFIGTYAPRHNVRYNLPSGIMELDGFFADFIDYYNHAKDRDYIMNANTLARMEELGVDIAIQVCGGFHTDGMMRELKREKNILCGIGSKNYKG